MPPIRVLIGATDPGLLSAFDQVLQEESEMEVIGTEGYSEAVVTRSREGQPDVVVLDLDSAELNALDVCRRLAAQQPAPRILVVTGDEREETAVQAFQAGAKGMVPRHLARVALGGAIRTVAEGWLWMTDQRVTARLIEEVAALWRRQEREERLAAHLTPVEREVLALVGSGHTYPQIAAELAISPSTVRRHLRNILHKLNLPNRLEAALFARRVGLTEPPMNGDEERHLEPQIYADHKRQNGSADP